MLDENRATEEYEGLVIHRISLGRETMPPDGRRIWDCPHTMTLRMMYQSLELLHLEERFDVLHSYFLYPVGYITGLLASRYKVPTVATLVGNDLKKYVFSPEKAALCRNGLENADRVVCLSRELLELADALTPIVDKARVIHNSVEIPERGRSWNRPSKPPFRIGTAGDFKYAKGLPYLFKAAAGLRSRFSLTVSLKGAIRPSEMENYHNWLNRTGVDDMVCLDPPGTHNDVFEWLRSLDIFVLPSVSEGCPNILMEAMSVGLPCAAARVGAVEDLMISGRDGLSFPWANSRALAEAVEDILTRPDLGASLGQAARERMRLFSPQKEQAAWETLYRGLLDW